MLKKRWTLWVSVVIIVSLLAGCSNATNYIKKHYDLVNVSGVGRGMAEMYSAPNQSVPNVTQQIASQEQPKEVSKSNEEQMFLVYSNKVINIQQDPKQPKNAVVEIDTISYAKEHYSPSFMQGYFTATILQSIFGYGWYHTPHPYNYRGYAYNTSNKTYGSSGNAPPVSKTTKKPATAQKSGTFKTKTTKKSGGFWKSLTSSLKKGASSFRKYDGSRKYRFSRPKTSRGFGSFHVRIRR